MSSALGMAAATKVIAAVIDSNVAEAKLTTILGTISTSLKAPDAATKTDAAGVNLFLYNATQNQGWRSEGLPSWDAGGQRIGRPYLPLDLHYVVSAYGETDYDREILLGLAMQALHETATLDRTSIDTILSGVSSNLGQALLGAGLQNQIEQIRIAPVPLSTDDLSKLWMAFQAPLRPSACYVASVVLIEKAGSVQFAPPVKQRNLAVIPYELPMLTSVTPTEMPAQTPVSIVLTGSNLGNPLLEVLLNDSLSLAIDRANSNDTTLAVSMTTLTDGTAAPAYSSGTVTLQVVRRLAIGVGTKTVLRSNTLLLALQTTVASAVAATKNVTLTLKPNLLKDQEVSLQLITTGGAGVPSTLLFNAQNVAAGPTVLVNTDAPTGTYFYSVAVDGASTSFTFDAQGRLSGPTLSL